MSEMRALETYAEEMFHMGLDAMDNDEYFLALSCLEQAGLMREEPLYCSSLAVCMARTRRTFKQALELCQEALDKDPGNAVHYLNLGRVYLSAGKKKKAIQIFRDGLRKEKNRKIIQELDDLGTRKPLLFSTLERNHPLNKFSGILMKWLGCR